MNSPDQYKNVIAITGMNARPDNPGPGLAVARCLKEDPKFTGEIIGLGYDVLEPGLYLNEVCSAGFLLPYPSVGKEALLGRLTEIHRQKPFGILIPCLDAELIGFTKIQDELHQMGVSLLIPTEEQLKRRNKDKLHELAQAIGIKSPESRNVTNSDFFYRCHTEGWNYPLVVKGVFYDAAIAHTPEQAVTIFHRIAAEWGLPVLVQRFVQGEEINLCGVGDGQGNMVGAVTMRKRALTDKGKAWAGVSVIDETITQAASAFVKETQWTGPFEFEVMRDNSTNVSGKAGDYNLIEINPRFPAWVYLTTKVGCNLPLLLIHLLREEVLPQLGEPIAGMLFLRYAEETVIDLKQFEEMTMNGMRLP